MMEGLGGAGGCGGEEVRRGLCFNDEDACNAHQAAAEAGAPSQPSSSSALKEQKIQKAALKLARTPRMSELISCSAISTFNIPARKLII